MSQKVVISTPPAEIEITPSLVRQLIQSQQPDLAHLSLELIDSGWDNDMYRLGMDYVVRLPRREVSVKLLKNEQIWLPKIAARLPCKTSVSLRIGQPEFGYPWTWSILPWIAGKTADLSPLAADQAIPLVQFLKALHILAPEDAPINVNRGVALQVRAAAIEERLTRLRLKTNLITQKIDQIWAAALEADPATAFHWVHGDLHARNVIVNEGEIGGIIDWGDLNVGDIANDLACIWMLLEDADARAAAIAAYQPSTALLARAKGWAIFFGTILLETGLVDNLRHAAMGKATLERLVKDEK